MQTNAISAADATVQFVTFVIGDETYGVPVDMVGEVIHTQFVADVPGMPGFVEGITNLRGNVVPVVSLRKRLGLPAGEADQDQRIMVVVHEGEHIGLTVDEVHEVLTVAAQDIEPASAIVSAAEAELVQGIAKAQGRFVILLDTERLLARGDVGRRRPALPGGREAPGRSLPEGRA